MNEDPIPIQKCRWFWKEKPVVTRLQERNRLFELVLLCEVWEPIRFTDELVFKRTN